MVPAGLCAIVRGGSEEGGLFVVRVAGADRPSRGLVGVPKRLQALDDGGVPTRSSNRAPIRLRAMP